MLVKSPVTIAKFVKSHANLVKFAKCSAKLVKSSAKVIKFCVKITKFVKSHVKPVKSHVTIAKSRVKLVNFVQSVQRTIQRLNLDGIDLDWEFPNDIVQNEKDKFIQLLNEIRENVINSVNKYLLSVAVAAPVTLVETSYNVTEINRLVDFVNLMSYDYNFFSFWTPWTGMNAPLYAKSDDTLYFSTQNINFSSNYWIRKGMMREKINIGLPVYAHTYTLRTPRKTYLGAPAIGDGRLGGGGSAKYGTVCDFIHQQKLSPVFHEETKSPYVTNGSEWVSFENDQSMKYKADYIYENHYGGAMIFSLSSDDYEGKCKPGETFPNTRIIHKIFNQ
ncbi:hypothetical protein WA026_005256 [Henosepilachna vigintioctopunctata]|uniref:GH18 domain-containing protein n=1 Tax=Henosepilachna vigintioctopunctata TaxID=420089 RepID=A0AAW1UU00_9CUCU